jgi:hypothetical protein
MNKLYSVEKISFYDFSVSAVETDLTIEDVPENEIFEIEDFPDFKVILSNWSGKVVDFAKYVESKKVKS